MAIRVPLPAHEADDSADGQERGGPVAFEDLWQHRAALRDICQRIVGDAATADDVVQETYLRALRNLDRLEQRPSLMPWLATVARRRSIDELRRRQYQRPVDAVPDRLTKLEHDPSETAAVNDTVGQVRDALTALTERERELLMRQVNLGLSLTELADWDQSSVASVRSVLSRARTKLRDALEDAGAHVVAPLGLLGAWMKRKIGAVNARVQRMPTVLPAGYERVGEMATAAAAAAALAITGALPSVLDAERPATVLADAIAASSSAVDAFGAGDSALGSASDSAVTGSRGTAAGGALGGTELAGAATGGGSGADGGAGAATGNVPVPDPTRPRSLPQAPEGSPFAGESEPESPEDTRIVQLVAPTPAAGSQDPQPVFALGQASCGLESCDVLWYSPNGGETWTRRSASGLDAGMIAVPDGYSQAHQTVFASGAGGLLVSFDGGEHFESAAGGPAFVGSIAPSPGFWAGDPSVYVGGTPSTRYDTEHGITMPLPVGSSTQPAHFAFAPSFPATDVMYAGTVSMGDEDWVASVYRCTSESCVSDRGPTVLAGVSTPPVVAVPASSSDGSLVLAWVGDRIFRSTDGGASFSRVAVSVPGAITGFAERGIDLYLSVWDVGPDAFSGAILHSSNGGASWAPLPASGALRAGVQAVTALADGRLLAAPTGNGIFCSSDHGATWSPRCETDERA